MPTHRPDVKASLSIYQFFSLLPHSCGHLAGSGSRTNNLPAQFVTIRTICRSVSCLAGATYSESRKEKGEATNALMLSNGVDVDQKLASLES
jgi:hypothetical protein